MGTPFLYITGTDVGVGKTRVATALARALADLGARVVALKPVETGCASEQPRAVEDGVALARATGQAAPRAALCRLAPRLPAPLAAELRGGRLDFDNLLAAVRAAGEGADAVLIEGHDGPTAPLTWDHTDVQLARAVKAQALLVVPDRRGALGQTTLATQALTHARVKLAGLVVNQVQPPGPHDPAIGLTAAALRNLHGLPPAVNLPHVDHLGAAARALEPLARRLLRR